jgi:hypothetical protein
MKTKAADFNDIHRERGSDGARKAFDEAYVNGSGRASDQTNCGGKSKFTPIMLDDVTVDDEPAYIVDGIIPAGPSFGEIPAPPKSLKSFFLTDLLMHIAIGKPYAGRQVQQGVTAYVTSEGVRGVKCRAVAMRRYHQVEGKKVPFILVPVMPNLGTGDGDRKQLRNQGSHR